MINAAAVEMSRSPMIWWNLAACFLFMVTLVLCANLFCFGRAGRLTRGPDLVRADGCCGLPGSLPQPACAFLAILSEYEIVDLPIEYCSTASEMLSLLSRRATTLSLNSCEYRMFCHSMKG